MLRRLLPDPFILWLIGAVLLGSLLPVRGGAASLIDTATLAAIFLLFFLHGVRLPREALVSALTDWRLHLAILAATFAVFPLAGLALAALVPGLLTPPLWAGVFFLCVLPSTVQSSIAFTWVAGGNVAGAVAAAAASNLLGVVLTPLLLSLLLNETAVDFSAAAIGKIFALLVLPFGLGHLLRPMLIGAVQRRPGLTTGVDKGTILLAVYGAFSAAAVDGLWSRLPPLLLASLIAVCLGLLGIVLLATAAIGRLGGFDRGSRAAILFCGSVKSLASGVPMARILFPGAGAGFVILPIMIFHSAQLILCAWLAARIGAQSRPEVRSA